MLRRTQEPSLSWVFFTLGVSCPQPSGSRSSRSPTAARSTVAAPIAVGPDTRWRPQSNADCPADVGGDVGHGVVPEDELSCLLSLLSAVTEPSEVTPVTDTRDSADSSVSCDRTVIRWA